MEPTDDIALVFAPGGPVARLLGPTYRPRRGQAQMARLVMRALERSGHLLVEAGTGSGKSFAYLIPLIWTGRRAFVSTANKTLQNQLCDKDLPALQRIAPKPFTAALLKGRSNYVCRLRLRELAQQSLLPGMVLGAGADGRGLTLPDLLDLLEATPSGDVEELGLYGSLRDTLTVGSSDCLGERCPMHRECYHELARLWAEEADIVVINHALLAHNLVLNGQIVQPREVVVIDEAQEFPAYVIGARRANLEYDRVPAFVNDQVVLRNADDRIRGRAVQINHELFTQIHQTAGSGPDRRWAAPEEIPLVQELAVQLNAIRGQLMKRYPPVPGVGEENQENARHQMMIEQSGMLAAEIQLLGRPLADDQVRYCEQVTAKSDLARIALRQEPLDVSEFLAETLWKQTKTVVCTSATVTVGNSFDHFRRQTGAPEENIQQSLIDSPFDFAQQALLYTPHGLYPDYGEGEESYVQNLAGEVERLVRASRGRAFVLCTSMRRARQLFDMLEPQLPHPCYCQGMAARSELLDWFRTDGDGAVLFATKSFWEGVDVPGEALSLVIIDKLPFAPHLDPVVQRREEYIKEAGGEPFSQLMLPEAILALKQGVGRLIRTETDRGVMAILDSRINTKRYGAQIVASLPRARRTSRFEDVVAFFEE